MGPGAAAARASTQVVVLPAVAAASVYVLKASLPLGAIATQKCKGRDAAVHRRPRRAVSAARAPPRRAPAPPRGAARGGTAPAPRRRGRWCDDAGLGSTPKHGAPRPPRRGELAVVWLPARRSHATLSTISASQILPASSPRIALRVVGGVADQPRKSQPPPCRKRPISRYATRRLPQMERTSERKAIKILRFHGSAQTTPERSA